MDPKDFYRYIIGMTLDYLALDGVVPRVLLLGTAMIESGLSHIRQHKGPALGLFQMEPRTHDDLWANWLLSGPTRAGLARDIRLLAGQWPLGLEDRDYYPLPSPSAMQGNLYYATAMARAQYLRSPIPLPMATPEALAQYWKTIWNTTLGKGSIGKATATMAKAFAIQQAIDEEDEEE